MPRLVSAQKLYIKSALNRIRDQERKIAKYRERLVVCGNEKLEKTEACFTQRPTHGNRTCSPRGVTMRIVLQAREIPNHFPKWYVEAIITRRAA